MQSDTDLNLYTESYFHDRFGTEDCFSSHKVLRISELTSNVVFDHDLKVYFYFNSAEEYRADNVYRESYFHDRFGTEDRFSKQ